MEDQVHVTLNTSASAMSPCVDISGPNNLYTAAAAIWQPAPAGCGVVAHRRLAGVDDDYTARAAIRLQVGGA